MPLFPEAWQKAHHALPLRRSDTPKPGLRPWYRDAREKGWPRLRAFRAAWRYGR